jgi:KipI family sensor histidine kinase inhibitor
MRLLPYGPSAWLVELDEADVTGYAAALTAQRRDDVVDVVPAACSVLVQLRSAAAAHDARAWMAELTPEAIGGTAGSAVEIAVRYDGDDLLAVAEATQRSIEEVIARHHAPTYVCAFCGFAPGFAYLRGLDPALVLPRRATPRTRVPAGAVAIADTYTAVYPSESPGGWHLIGRTEAPMWDPEREEPALVAPGTVVRFIPR